VVTRRAGRPELPPGRPGWPQGRLGDLRRPVLREAGRPRGKRREDVLVLVLPLGLCTMTTGVRRRLGFPCSCRWLRYWGDDARDRSAGARRAADSAKIAVDKKFGSGIEDGMQVGMKTDRIRTDITHIIFVFIFLFGFGFGHG